MYLEVANPEDEAPLVDGSDLDLELNHRAGGESGCRSNRQTAGGEKVCWGRQQVCSSADASGMASVASTKTPHTSDLLLCRSPPRRRPRSRGARSRGRRRCRACRQARSGCPPRPPPMDLQLSSVNRHSRQGGLPDSAGLSCRWAAPTAAAHLRPTGTVGSSLG